MAVFAQSAEQVEEHAVAPSSVIVRGRDGTGSGSQQTAGVAISRDDPRSRTFDHSERVR
jgi:hypothetical protein